MIATDPGAAEDRLLAALREGEERYRFLAENLPAQIWTALPDGKLDYVTDQAARHHGVSAAQLLDEGWHDIVHPDDLPRATERWKRALSTGEAYEVEMRLKLHDGNYALHLSRAFAQRDAAGRIVRWVGSNMDIEHQARALQERERLLQDLEAKQALIDAIIQQIPAGIVAREAPSGKVLFSNEQVSKIMRHPTEPSAEFVDYVERNFYYPNGRQYSVRDAPLMRSLRGEIVVDEDVVYRCPDGAIVMIRCNSFPTRDRAGTIVAATAVFYDITSSDRLERERVDLLAREQAARADAEQANHAKDTFLATASHELRTPLNAILGWARMLRSGQLDPSGYLRAVETIERNALAQVQLIEDILDGSRITTGKLHLEIRLLDMTALVRAALDAVRPAADAKRIEVLVALDPEAARMAGDPERLQQVVWNLANNAIKFTPSGGTVGVFLRRLAAHVQLVVTDSGQGIEPEFLPHVFERFRQAEGSTTRRHGGLGLGLALVRHLVEAHGGTVRAESAGVGRGATFVVTLPVLAVLAERVEPGPARPAPDTGGELPASSLRGVTVLVVDDETDARDLVATVLRSRGAEVTTAPSAAEGMDIIAKSPPTILVSDVGMPDSDGYELIRRVRGLGDTKGGHVPAIALTAYAREEDRRRALDAGFQTHVAKPVEPAELVRVVAGLVRHAAEERRGYAR